MLDPACRALVQRYVKAQLKDNVKARVLSSSGEWVPVTRSAGEAPFNSQEYLLARAYRDAEEAASETAREHREACVADLLIDGPAAMAQAEAELDAVEASAIEARTQAASRRDAKTPQTEAAAATAGIPVKATIVEPEPDSQAESAPRATAGSSRGQHARPKAAAKKALARRQPGRFKLGLGLIGMGIKTLITGKTK